MADKKTAPKTDTKTTKSAPKELPPIDRQKDGTIILNITIPAAQVEATRKVIIDELAKKIEVPGFRKGNVPRDIAEAKLSKEAIREELLKKILTDEYIKAVKANNLNPIINPRIHIDQFEDGTDLKFSAETAEAPKVELGNYKAEIAKIKPEAPKIIVPGQKEPEAEGEPSKKLDQILESILSTVKISIPKILIDNETNRLMSQLYDELKKLGMTVDQYIQSRNTTIDKMRAEYDEKAEKDLKLEFTLRQIADEEKITVEEADIKAAFDSIKDVQQKQELAQNPYIVAAIIRQQKTLDFLSKL